MMHHGFKRYIGLAMLVLILALVTLGTASAQPSPIHPTFPLLDENGVNVLDSGNPVSVMKTCGGCHDTELIENHNFHSEVGLNQMYPAGEAPSGRPWDTSEGLFGLWDPITYRYLSPLDDKTIDLTTADWIKVYGGHHAGGGPAVTSRYGLPLEDLAVSADNPETSILNPKTGELEAWNWKESGTVEGNCFLCHTPNPNNQARIDALQEGEFGWANTATLMGTGIVQPNADGEGMVYNQDAFDEQGNLKQDVLPLQSPSSENCGQCHGKVQTDVTTALTYQDFGDSDWTTQRTGQIFSGQRISDSALNIKGKSELTRSWDVHAERNLKCTDCHYAVNNPAYYEPPKEVNPKHLTFEPRRPDISDYLQKPLHEFAHGASTMSELHAGSADMRRCESCHDYESTHTWLPYEDRHAQKLSCEACHVPAIHATAIQQNDWTVLGSDGKGVLTYRGVGGDGNPRNPNNLFDGFNPILLPRYDSEGNAKLAPFNLISSWYWVYGDPVRPVRQMDLQKAFFDDSGAYKAEIVAAFDANGDGRLATAELRIDNEAKEKAVQAQLEALGLANPRIQAEVQPYSISHSTTWGQYSTKDCSACHSDDSRVSAALLLASYTPGGVTPTLVGNINVEPTGDMVKGENGELYYKPSTADEGIYLFGHDRIIWLDWLGILMLLGVLGFVVIHGGLRIIFAKRQASSSHGRTTDLYLYTFSERLWHWVQAIAILLLIITGSIVHRPDMFGGIDMGWAIPVHNFLGLILVLDAAFAIFYFLLGHRYKQFFPEPKGFFYNSLIQARFYAMDIFVGKPHPFEKTDQLNKMNPIQQATYLAILFILLPAQLVTGILLWGSQHWAALSDAIGGLRYIAPIHTIVAWAFLAFVIMHMYLTTTGHTPLAAVEGMITGWEEVEVEEEDPMTTV